jgi:hypothetical protein
MFIIKYDGIVQSKTIGSDPTEYGKRSFGIRRNQSASF